MPIMTMTIERQKAVQHRGRLIKCNEEWGQKRMQETLGRSREINGQKYITALRKQECNY